MWGVSIIVWDCMWNVYFCVCCTYVCVCPCCVCVYVLVHVFSIRKKTTFIGINQCSQLYRLITMDSMFTMDTWLIEIIKLHKSSERTDGFWKIKNFLILTADVFSWCHCVCINIAFVKTKYRKQHPTLNFHSCISESVHGSWEHCVVKLGDF